MWGRDISNSALSIIKFQNGSEAFHCCSCCRPCNGIKLWLRVIFSMEDSSRNYSSGNNLNRRINNLNINELYVIQAPQGEPKQDRKYVSFSILFTLSFSDKTLQYSARTPSEHYNFNPIWYLYLFWLFTWTDYYCFIFSPTGSWQCRYIYQYL